MGADDLLRSKDMDSDSYDSGDWFNHIDWSGRTSNWGTGLPPAQHNRMRWEMERPLLSDPSLRPAPVDIHLAETTFREFLKIRYSSALFRMQTSREIESHLHFLNVGPEHIPGTIVMMLDSAENAHGRYKHVLVVFNATLSQQTITSEALCKLPLRLHPVQRTSSDHVVREARFDRISGTVVIPPLATAVFVSPRQHRVSLVDSGQRVDASAGSSLAAGTSLTGWITARGSRQRLDVTLCGADPGGDAAPGLVERMGR
jgi:pullulanase